MEEGVPPMVGQTSRDERAPRRAEREIGVVSPHVPLAAMGGAEVPPEHELLDPRAPLEGELTTNRGGGPTDDRRSLGDRRARESPDPTSLGHRSLSQEETASELRQMREEMRQMQLTQQMVHRARGGGETYKVPCPISTPPKETNPPQNSCFNVNSISKPQACLKTNRSPWPLRC